MEILMVKISSFSLKTNWTCLKTFSCREGIVRADMRWLKKNNWARAGDLYPWQIICKSGLLWAGKIVFVFFVGNSLPACIGIVRIKDVAFKIRIFSEKRIIHEDSYHSVESRLVVCSNLPVLSARVTFGCFFYRLSRPWSNFGITLWLRISFKTTWE